MEGTPRRSDPQLRAQSVHVLWEFRQLAQLGTHLTDRTEQGIHELADALDAAALEAFCLHARALIEFLWRDRAQNLVRSTDAVAGEWFETGEWEREPALPAELADVARRTGFGVAHISYNRIDPAEAWGWDHASVVHRIAHRFACFVDDVPDSRVHDAFKAVAARVNMDFRLHLAEREPGLFPPPQHPIGTPANVSLWIRSERND